MAEVARLFPEIDPRADADAKARNDAEARKDTKARNDTKALADAARIVEAILFSASEPVAEAVIAKRLPGDVAIGAVMARLKADYAHRGVVLVRVGTKWLFRTADDLAWLLSPAGRAVKKLSRAALETLAIIAYHQPTTRAEIEDIRGVAISKGTLDVLLETGWVRPRGRRRAPGRPITYGTTDGFLLHFGLEVIGDLPGLEELRGAGLFDGRLPPSFSVPEPHDGDLQGDEDPLDGAAPEEDGDAELYAPEDGDDAPDLVIEDPDSLDRDPFA